MLFSWFRRRKAQELSPEMRAFADKTLKPIALAVAISEAVRDHAKAIKSGRLSFPAHKRENANVEGIWADLRLEALSALIGFGRANLTLLADFRRQAEMLSAFLDERPHLEVPQPRGEPIADTWQAVWHVYLYLDAVGSEVMDSATDHISLSAEGRDILSELTAQSQELRGLWVAFERAVRSGTSPRPEVPRTALDVIWIDVTAKTKSIALSTVFGPDPEATIQMLLDSVVRDSTPAEAASARAALERLRAARQPEEICEPVRASR